LTGPGTRSHRFEDEHVVVPARADRFDGLSDFVVTASLRETLQSESDNLIEYAHRWDDFPVLGVSLFIGRVHGRDGVIVGDG
jgi:hypothetical protein